eukprot:gb/GECG01014119.1/.p1 GENE.gb/GECG01014119.1/~~gb/GECG01014119.1/.p1  ORF type:complete len:134 (+),score=19.96 gb/GECG01014119.1/:1-402(+)
MQSLLRTFNASFTRKSGNIITKLGVVEAAPLLMSCWLPETQAKPVQAAYFSAGDQPQAAKPKGKPGKPKAPLPDSISDYSNSQLRSLQGTDKEKEAREELTKRLEKAGGQAKTKEGKERSIGGLYSSLLKLRT